MGKPKLRPLPAILKLVESLSEDERADLRDYLRPAPKPRSKPKPERKPSQKRKAGKEATATTDSDNPGHCAYNGCQQFFSDNIHHKQTMPGYHEFVEPVGEASKGAGV